MERGPGPRGKASCGCEAQPSPSLWSLPSQASTGKNSVRRAAQAWPPGALVASGEERKPSLSPPPPELPTTLWPVQALHFPRCRHSFLSLSLAVEAPRLVRDPGLCCCASFLRGQGSLVFFTFSLSISNRPFRRPPTKTQPPPCFALPRLSAFSEAILLSERIQVPGPISFCQ